MESINVDVGNRVEITLNKEEKTMSFISVVEDVYENNLVLMHMPISYGSLIKLPMNLDYKMMFYTEKGMFKYSARIIKYVAQDNFNFMVVELCSDAERFQRREFFRFDCIIEFKFDKLLADESEAKFDADTIIAPGIIKDLSAGGIRFIANEVVSEKEIIKCIVPLKDELIICAARVISRQYFPKSNYKYQYRVEFVLLNEGQRDMIIKYIFEEQRRLAKRS